MDQLLGRVARSRAGRDKGRYGIVVSVLDENYVYIADGDRHKIGSPKKKKLKHLFMRPETAGEISEKLNAGVRVYDQEVRAALKAMNYDQANGLKEG